MKRVLKCVVAAALISMQAGAARAAQEAEPETSRPLRWLVAAQNEDGSWGDEPRSKSPDVATTALAGLALLRLGHDGSGGEYGERTVRAAKYVAAAVERTPPQEVAINPPGTLPQRKLGRNIDTFVAAQFLAELAKTMPAGPDRSRVYAALESCVSRIQHAQKADGSFAQDGWAPLLSSAFASGGLYAARNAGARVEASVLAHGDDYLLGRVDAKTGAVDTSSSAGVSLYAAAASGAAAERAEKDPASSKHRAEQARDTGKAAQAAMGDERVLRGFGSYGGEEHVSYMMTTEVRAAKGGKEWDEWRRGIHARLKLIQRADGTWRGDHCITSTTFCTAASLITLAIRPAPAQSGKS